MLVNVLGNSECPAEPHEGDHNALPLSFIHSRWALHFLLCNSGLVETHRTVRRVSGPKSPVWWSARTWASYACQRLSCALMRAVAWEMSVEMRLTRVLDRRETTKSRWAALTAGARGGELAGACGGASVCVNVGARRRRVWLVFGCVWTDSVGGRGLIRWFPKKLERRERRHREEKFGRLGRRTTPTRPPLIRGRVPA